MASSASVIVRKAVKSDLGAILAMIQELADFEEMPNGPKLTVQDLERDGGFNNNDSTSPVFQSFVLELAERIQTEGNKEKLTSSAADGDLSTRTKLIGYAIFFYAYSTWQGKTFFLEDIYVKPDYRSHGYGELLFRHLVRHARENACVRVDFHVLAWNPAKKFYHRMGATNQTESEQWEFFRLTKEKMDALCSNDVL